VGNTLSLLYFANSLGAAVGVLVAGFVLVGLVGLPGRCSSPRWPTSWSRSSCSSSRAAAAQTTPRNRPSRRHRSPRRPGVVPLSLSLRRLLLAVSFGTAISSFIYEIGWIRMLSLVLGSATHSFELMLSAFILGLACGAFAIRRRSDAGAASVRTLALVQIAMGVLAVATLPVYLQSFHWMADFMAAFSRTAEGYRAFSLARYFHLPRRHAPGDLLRRHDAAAAHAPAPAAAAAGGGDRAGVRREHARLDRGRALAALVLLPLVGLKWLLVGGAAIDVLLGALLLALPESNVVASRVAGGPCPSPPARSWPSSPCHQLRPFGAHERCVSLRECPRAGQLERAVLLRWPHGDDQRAAHRLERGLSLATNGKPDASLGPEWFRQRERRDRSRTTPRRRCCCRSSRSRTCRARDARR
jgi:hypothetical protein